MSARSALQTLCSAVLLFAPATARANEFDDFRIPDNHALLWTGSADVHGRVSGQSSRLLDDHTGSGSMGLSSAGWWRSDADAHSTSVAFSVSANGARSHEDRDSRSEFSPTTLSDDTSDRRLAQSIAAGVDHLHYVAGSPWFISGSLSGMGGYSQEWGTHEGRHVLDASDFQTSRDTSSDWRYDNSFSASLGIGAGHVRNATGVYEARVLERRLRESDALTRPLSAGARTQLASLMYSRYVVDAVHERPAAELWGAIERILRADGAVRDSGVTAEEWFRAVEPYFTHSYGAGADIAPVSPVLRLRGYSAGIRAQFDTDHQILRFRHAGTEQVVTGGIPSPTSRTNAYARYHSSFDAARAGVWVEGHWPMSERVQVDAHGSALRDIRAHEDGFQVSSEGQVAWMIAERWLITTHLSQNRSISDDSNPGGGRLSIWGVQADAAATFFVADHLGASLQWYAGRSRIQFGGTGPDWRDSNGSGFDFRVTYRLAGLVSIPALQPFMPN